MRDLGLVVLGIVIGILLMALFSKIVVLLVVSLAVVGAFTLYVAVTKKSGSSRGG